MQARSSDTVTSATLGHVLAHGRTADVYNWTQGRILKLCHDWVGEHAVRREAMLTQAAEAEGLPVPHVYDIVQIQERWGIIYAQVNGQSMLTELKQRPWSVLRLAGRLADLQRAVHAVKAPGMVPVQADLLSAKIDNAVGLSTAQRDAAQAALRAMPTGDRLCHGDFHPDNVLLTHDSAVLIDWVDAGRGRPAADVARTSIIWRGAIESGQVAQPLLRVLGSVFHRAYCTRYFRFHPHEAAEYRRWLPLVAAARLSEQIPDQEAWLVRTATTPPPRM